MTTKRKAVNYNATIVEPSRASTQLKKSNSHDMIQKGLHPPPLPTRINNTSALNAEKFHRESSSGINQPSLTGQQPTLPRRNTTNTNVIASPINLKHSKQQTNSSIASSQAESIIGNNNLHQNTLPRSQTTTSIATSNSSDQHSLAMPKRAGANAIFISSQKRLVPNDNMRNANTSLSDAALMEDILGSSGLARSGGGVLKDIKKHVRGQTRSYHSGVGGIDDANVDQASMEGGGSAKSTREDQANSRIRQLFQDMEDLKKRNEELEAALTKNSVATSSPTDTKGIKSVDKTIRPTDPNTENDLVKSMAGASVGVSDSKVNKIWQEIEDCTIVILNTLGMDIEGNPLNLLHNSILGPNKAIPNHSAEVQAETIIPISANILKKEELPKIENVTDIIPSQKTPKLAWVEGTKGAKDDVTASEDENALNEGKHDQIIGKEKLNVKADKLLNSIAKELLKPALASVSTTEESNLIKPALSSVPTTEEINQPTTVSVPITEESNLLKPTVASVSPPLPQKKINSSNHSFLLSLPFGSKKAKEEEEEEEEESKESSNETLSTSNPKLSKSKPKQELNLGFELDGFEYEIKF